MPAAGVAKIKRHPGAVGLLPLARVPETKVSRLVKAPRQNMLNETSNELNARQPLGSPRVFAAVFPAESHMGLIHVKNPRVPDRRPKGVA